ncbi:uncharacterized protein At3g52155, chloroplastic isoform X3 [Corylus avellana]|uniref:uncharacterized protein At3g52155, chloroplastic isoform X3 n=1 Tax=Corylus avellana TaxID=13451 RepID=UPI00286C2865|nr:uncharacterized protein At3g52155, chloroplastic isoform X3 [Corylus avellana]
MNAATVCKMTIEPTSRTQVSANPIWRPKTSNSIRGGRRRNPSCFRLAARSSLIIETVEGQAPSESDSIARRLILLRHAESSWEYPSLRDHDRPLSKAGQADAVIVSQKLQQLGWIPELILSSDAVRTRETLKIMQEQVRDFLEAEVCFISSFYSIAAMDGQTADHLQHVICKHSKDEILTVINYTGVWDIIEDGRRRLQR